MRQRFLLALSMPIALILLILAMIYWPSQQPTADENFIFSETSMPFCEQGYYVVEKEKIVWHATKKPANICPKSAVPQLYLYNVVKKQTEPLDFKTAKMFRLNPAAVSPGGFVVSQSIRDSKFSGLGLLSMYSSNNLYLIGHGHAIPISAIAEKHQYTQFKFLGWVKA
jgi:hypothetical protein